MMVARQFIAWDVSKTGDPSRRARSDPYLRLISRPRAQLAAPKAWRRQEHEHEGSAALALITTPFPYRALAAPIPDGR